MAAPPDLAVCPLLWMPSSYGIPLILSVSLSFPASQNGTCSCVVNGPSMINYWTSTCSLHIHSHYLLAGCADCCCEEASSPGSTLSTELSSGVVSELSHELSWVPVLKSMLKSARSHTHAHTHGPPVILPNKQRALSCYGILVALHAVVRNVNGGTREK